MLVPPRTKDEVATGQHPHGAAGGRVLLPGAQLIDGGKMIGRTAENGDRAQQPPTRYTRIGIPSAATPPPP